MHSNGSRQSPLTQPGKQTHFEQSEPDHPTSQVQVFGRVQFPFSGTHSGTQTGLVHSFISSLQPGRQCT